MPDIHVPADYPTIPAAITAAVDGDVIYVAAGTWTGQLTVNKRITLRGAQYATPAPARSAVAVEFILEFSAANGVVVEHSSQRRAWARP